MALWVVHDSQSVDWPVPHTVSPVSSVDQICYLEIHLHFFVPLLRKYRTWFINKITLIKGISCYGHSEQEWWSYQTWDISQDISAKFLSKSEQPSASAVPEVHVVHCSMWKEHRNFYTTTPNNQIYIYIKENADFQTEFVSGFLYKFTKYVTYMLFSQSLIVILSLRQDDLPNE